MSELPDRPDLDQLRRQARELLRAATEGDPHSLTRLRAVSERVTLSAAQLALAREYGFSSWPALRTEAERRRRLLEPTEGLPSGDADGRPYLDSFEDRWSFGGATAIDTVAGVLSSAALIISPGHATLDALLMSSEETRRPRAALPWPGEATREMQAGADAATLTAQVQTVIDDVIVTDDRESRYTFRAAGMDGGEPIWLRLRLDPVPARECGWIELRSQGGSATRLLPSARPVVRVSQAVPASGSLAQRELSAHALSLIELRLTGSGHGAQDEDHLRLRCSAALARAAEIRHSGELDAASELPDQLARLCASLTGHYLADGLPSAWSGMLNAAQKADGLRHHLDLAAVLPPVDDTVVQVDSLISELESWHVYLRVRPGWWTYGEDRHHKLTAVSVDAEDNLGGMYLSVLHGSTGHRDYEEVTLGFMPRLDPLARALKLTFRGASEQVAVELRLIPAP